MRPPRLIAFKIPTLESREWLQSRVFRSWTWAAFCWPNFLENAPFSWELTRTILMVLWFTGEGKPIFAHSNDCPRYGIRRAARSFQKSCYTLNSCAMRSRASFRGTLCPHNFHDVSISLIITTSTMKYTISRMRKTHRKLYTIIKVLPDGLGSCLELQTSP